MADQARRAQEHTQSLGRHAHEHAHGVLHKLQQHKPSGSQVLGFLTVLAVTGCILLFLAGLAITVTAITLVLLIPLFIFFSPVLIPVGFLLFLAVAGMLTAGGISIATVSAISWLYKYFKGRHPPGADQIEYARARMQDTATHMREKARDFLADAIQGKASAAAAPAG